MTVSRMQWGGMDSWCFVPSFPGQQFGQSAVRGCRPIPDEVEAAPSGGQRLVGAGDRVAEHLFAGCEAEGEPIAQRVACRRGQLGFLDEPTPRDVADVTRFGIGQVLSSHRREQAICAHEQVGSNAGAVVEMGGHPGLVLLGSDEGLSVVVVIIRERITQQRVEPAPAGQHLLKPQLAGDVAGLVEHAPARHRNAQRFRTHTNTGVCGHVEQLAVRNDAGASAGQLAAHTLEHVNVPAAAPEQQRGEQATHRAADDHGPFADIFS